MQDYLITLPKPFQIEYQQKYKISKEAEVAFWKQVDSGNPTDNNCWLWRGPLTGNGYCYFRIDGKDFSAKRMAYLLYYGKMPKNRMVKVRCGFKFCCNPHHLFVDGYRPYLDMFFLLPP